MFLISVMYFNVNAASVPYNWIVGGETVNESNANKTATNANKNPNNFRNKH